MIKNIIIASLFLTVACKDVKKTNDLNFVKENPEVSNNSEAEAAKE